VAGDPHDGRDLQAVEQRAFPDQARWQPGDPIA